MTSRLLPPLLALLVGCAPAPQAEDGLSFEASGRVIDGEFVITADLTPREQEQLGLQQLDWNGSIGFGLYLADDGVGVDALKRALEQRSRGAVVEANRPVDLFASNDPYRAYQWNLDLLDAETAWTYATGSGVTVAVLDTGVSSGGEDTPPGLVKGWDFVDNDSNPSDDVGHGTHVAGTIAQATDNGAGVAGVAPGVDLLAVRVLGAYGGTSYSVANGITYAADNGADVINLSLGSNYATSVEQRAIAYAIDRGVVVVAASGNEGASSVSYPAAYPDVIAVGAVRADGGVASYSNGGSALDVVAPGGDMGVDQTGDGYADGILQETVEYGSWGYRFYEGTSMASPHVAGAAALLLSAGAHPSEVPGLLASTASDVGSAGWDRWSGYGLIDPVAALRSVGSGTSAPETPSTGTADTTAPTISGVGGTRSGTKLTLWWTTDEPATSEIEFEGYGRYGDATSLVTEHELRFTIDSADTYEFRLIGVDEAGNEGVSDWWVTRP